MPTFLEIARHSPENCPMINEKARKVFLEAGNKLEGLLKKHGVKLVGAWNVHPEHFQVYVFDAPSFEAFYKCGMEPEIVAMLNFETSQIWVTQSFEDAMKMLKQAK
jgi:hypothetical protein